MTAPVTRFNIPCKLLAGPDLGLATRVASVSGTASGILAVYDQVLHLR